MNDADQFARRIIRQALTFTAARKSDGPSSGSLHLFTRQPMAALNGKRLALIIQEIQRETHAVRVLDLACGAGLIAGAISSLGHRTMGIDGSSDEIHIAREFAREAGHDAVFWCTDLFTDPDWERTAEDTLGGKPDIVVLAHALHRFPENEAFLPRLSRWLPSGTRLLINEENPRSTTFRMKCRIQTWMHKATDVRGQREFGDWKLLLERSGFEVARPRGVDAIPGLSILRPEQCWSLVFTARKA